MAKPGRPKKVVAVAKPEGNLTAAQIKMLSGGSDDIDPAPSEPAVTFVSEKEMKKPAKIWMPESADKKKFVRELAVNAFMELIKHNGKINNDWSDIVTREARALAEKLDF